ncbi:MAG: polysaccharide biosynthesis C-terminal domain-containing protein [Bacteroidales bacterium]|nr:polysaccharide biosynthesis C-terminal domain-containing protein [Bacteroidales bacterium]
MIRYIIHTFFTKTLVSSLGFLTIILISHILGPEARGEQSIFLSNVVLLILFTTLMGNSTLVYLAPRYDFSELFIPSFLWTILSLIIGFLLLPLFNNVVTYPIYLLLIVFFASINDTNSFILLGKERIKESNYLKIIPPLSTISILFVLFLLGKFSSTFNYVVSLLIGYALSFLFGIFFLRKDFLKLHLLEKKAFIYILQMMLFIGGIKQFGSIFQMLTSRLSFYIIAIYCGDKILGNFSNGISLLEVVLIFGTSLAMVQYSILSNTEDKVFEKMFSLIMTKLNIVFTFFALLVLCLLPSEVYTFIFGSGFNEIKNVIILLSLSTFLLSISSTFTQHFASKGNFTISAFSSFVAFLATCLFGFWLIPLYGIIGAAISTTISYAICLLIEGYYFKKWTKLKFSDFIIRKSDIPLIKDFLSNKFEKNKY